MTDHLAVQESMRGRLLALLVCSTGIVSLSSTADGYHRKVGSFVDDGFEEGMEVAPSGFVASGVGSIVAITDSDLRILGGRSVEADGPGRSLTVGLPSTRAWDNRKAAPVPGVPYVDEQYVRGPNVQRGIGPKGRLIGEPMYMPRVNVPNNTGIRAASKYTDAIIALYPPTDVIPLGNGFSAEVRGDSAPYGNQLLKHGDDHAGVLCVVPLRVYSINSI